jgi:hypothetical protein
MRVLREASLKDRRERRERSLHVPRHLRVAETDNAAVMVLVPLGSSFIEGRL